MRRLFVLAALLFALPSHAVTIDWVTVGDPGNAGDPQEDCADCGPGTNFGSVAYTYLIGKYEVTNAQYAEFLNAVAATDTYGLYYTSMGSGYGGITQDCSSGPCSYSTIAGREDMPVAYVSFWDALRFANWLHNGQPTGAQDDSTTEDGAYTLSGYTGRDGSLITRNPDAVVFLTSEDEWYKAAYYDASTLGYNVYPFADGFNGAVFEVPPGTTSHSSNSGFVVGDFTDVGSYTNSPSPYGTFDQAGNGGEFNEAIIGLNRGARGGYFSFSADGAAFSRGSISPTGQGKGTGFRVAMIPEPSTALLLAAGLAGLAVARRRQ